MLSLLFKWLLIGILLLLSVFSLSRLNANLKFDKLNQEVEKLNDNNYPAQLVEQLSAISSDRFLSYKELISLSRFFSTAGEKQISTELKLQYLCETISLLEKAISRESHNARSLVSWASLRQLLGNYACPQDRKELMPDNGLEAESADTRPEDWEAALDLAIKSAPLDQQVLFNSALVSVWGGKMEKASPGFYRVLELGTDSTAVQREYIYSLVKDQASLVSLIPATIPQILEFMRFAESGALSESTLSAIHQQLLAMQIKALQDFKARFVRHEIDAALYEQRLSEMWELSRHSEVLAVLDKLLSEYFSENYNNELRDFFNSRSKLSEIKVMPGYRPADSRPQKSALAYWGIQSSVALDNFFSSIGFFLPRNSTLRRIELHSKGLSDQSVSGFIRVFNSDDNSSWDDVTGLCTVSDVFFNSKTILQIDLPGSNKAFWKINFQNAGRTAKFSAPLDSLVRAFGIGGAN